MKKILVPVDYSSCSGNALRYALNFAKANNGEVYVHHVSSRDLTTDSSIEHAQKKLIDYSNGIATDNGLEEISGYCSVGSGKLVEETNRIVQEKGIDLVIMGTQGASGIEKVLVGSNTVDVINSCTRPVLVVPRKARFNGIQKILVAADFKGTDNWNDAEMVKDMAMEFDAEVRIAHVSKSRKEKLDPDQMLQIDVLKRFLFPDVKYSFKDIYDKKGVIHGLKFYMRIRHDNDMLVMLNRERSAFSNLFGNNSAQEMAFHTDLPLLVLQEK